MNLPESGELLLFEWIIDLLEHTLSCLGTQRHISPISSGGGSSVARVRSDLLGAILSQEVGLFDRRKSGEFMSRLSNDVESLRSAVSTEVRAAAPHID
jgi:ABC-type multidrug transport system fused ATPase/permease subunit